MEAYYGEVAHTRARRVLRSIRSHTGREICFDKTGNVDDVTGKAVGAAHCCGRTGGGEL